MTLNEAFHTGLRKEFGPVRYDILKQPSHDLTYYTNFQSLDFELPMYNCSNLKIRYLRVFERDKSYNPNRWVRNISQSNSYICRI
jgi:hypothetical protein